MLTTLPIGVSCYYPNDIDKFAEDHAKSHIQHYGVKIDGITQCIVDRAVDPNVVSLHVYKRSKLCVISYEGFEATIQTTGIDRITFHCKSCFGIHTRSEYAVRIYYNDIPYITTFVIDPDNMHPCHILLPSSFAITKNDKIRVPSSSITILV